MDFYEGMMNKLNQPNNNNNGLVEKVISSDQLDRQTLHR